MKVEHPFLSHAFYDRLDDSSPDHRSVKRHLLDLGIVLLEIWHETVFENWMVDEGLIPADSYSARYEAARKWLHDTGGNENVFKPYFSAVKRCVECAFPTDSTYECWNDKALKKALCQTVIEPLRESTQLAD